MKLADGTRAIYWYAWKGGHRLPGKYGSPEFAKAYNEAVASYEQPKITGTLADLTRAYIKSRGKICSGKGFLDLGARTRRDYIKQQTLIDAKWGNLPIKALSSPKVRGLFLDWRDAMSGESGRQADYAITVMRASWPGQRIGGKFR